jgi:hypothetical protein
VVAVVGERLGTFLAEGTEAQLALFAASCVERGAGVFFLAVAPDAGRAADADAFLELLDDLWGATTLTPADRHERQERIDGFAEMQGDEEPPGILAFAYDAVAAMYYAYSYLVSGDVENITYCSNHMLNSAGFIDNAADSGDRHHATEIAAQLGDMDLVSEGRTLDRERSRELGRDRIDALKAAFPQA